MGYNWTRIFFFLNDISDELDKLQVQKAKRDWKRCLAKRLVRERNVWYRHAAKRVRNDIGAKDEKICQQLSQSSTFVRSCCWPAATHKLICAQTAQVKQKKLLFPREGADRQHAPTPTQQICCCLYLSDVKSAK